MTPSQRKLVTSGAIVLIVASIGFLLYMLFADNVASYDYDSESSSSQSQSDFPSQERLSRLARTALRKAGADYRNPGPVELVKKLPDDSFIISVTLENGRRVSGRLFRDRNRYKITIDERDMFSKEIIIKTE